MSSKIVFFCENTMQPANALSRRELAPYENCSAVNASELGSHVDEAVQELEQIAASEYAISFKMTTFRESSARISEQHRSWHQELVPATCALARLETTLKQQHNSVAHVHPADLAIPIIQKLFYAQICLSQVKPVHEELCLLLDNPVYASCVKLYKVSLKAHLRKEKQETSIRDEIRKQQRAVQPDDPRVKKRISAIHKELEELIDPTVPDLVDSMSTLAITTTSTPTLLVPLSQSRTYLLLKDKHPLQDVAIELELMKEKLQEKLRKGSVLDAPSDQLQACERTIESYRKALFRKALTETAILDLKYISGLRDFSRKVRRQIAILTDLSVEGFHVLWTAKKMIHDYLVIFSRPNATLEDELYALFRAAKAFCKYKSPSRPHSYEVMLASDLDRTLSVSGRKTLQKVLTQSDQVVPRILEQKTFEGNAELPQQVSCFLQAKIIEWLFFSRAPYLIDLEVAFSLIQNHPCYRLLFQASRTKVPEGPFCKTTNFYFKAKVQTAIPEVLPGLYIRAKTTLVEHCRIEEYGQAMHLISQVKVPTSDPFLVACRQFFNDVAKKYNYPRYVLDEEYNLTKDLLVPRCYENHEQGIRELLFSSLIRAIFANEDIDILRAFFKPITKWNEFPRLHDIEPLIAIFIRKLVDAGVQLSDAETTILDKATDGLK